MVDFEDGEQLKALPCGTCADGEQLKAAPHNTQHKFHYHCIRRWLENHTTCPLCRYDLVPHSNKTRETAAGTTVRRCRLNTSG